MAERKQAGIVGVKTKKGAKMRQTMSLKKVKKYAKLLNLPIARILVRGGTDHRKDLCLEDGSISFLWPNGDVEKSDRRWKSLAQ